MWHAWFLDILISIYCIEITSNAITLCILGVICYFSLHDNQTPDYKYVMGQVEQQSGLTIGQEKEVICHLWSSRETTYQQLRHLQYILQDLNLPDNDFSAGLKVKSFIHKLDFYTLLNLFSNYQHLVSNIYLLKPGNKKTLFFSVKVLL